MWINFYFICLETLPQSASPFGLPAPQIGSRFHAYRATGRDCHHRDIGGHCLPGREVEYALRKVGRVGVEPQADRRDGGLLCHGEQQ